MNQSRLFDMFLLPLVLITLSLTTSATYGAEKGLIGSGETATSSLLAEDGYEDYWELEGDANDFVVITAATISGGVDPVICLYPPDSNDPEICATNYTSAQFLDHSLQQTGTYTVVVYDSGRNEAGEYSISFAKIPGAATSPGDPDGGEIASGQTLTGELSVLGDTDIYQFNGDAGDQIVLTAARIGGGIEPMIYLYPPDNSGLEASATIYTQAQLLDHRLLQTGQYTAVIFDSGMNEAGGYGISLVKIPGAATSLGDPDGGEIASGQTLTGELSVLGDTDIYQFDGEAGDQIVLTAAMIDGGIEPMIYLYPPDNSGLEASATVYTRAQRLDHRLQQTGLYTAVIFDSGMNEAGGYSISLVKIPGAVTSPDDPHGGLIYPDLTLTGALSPIGDTDIYQFYGYTEDQVVVTVNRISGGIEPLIYLYPPDNSGLEASAMIYTLTQTLSHQLAKTGLYSLVISDSGMNETGAFEITFSQTSSGEPFILNPYPANGSTITDANGAFSWNAVPEATGYDLYFSTGVAPPDEIICENLSAPTCSFPPLSAGTVYFWMVVAHTPNGDIQGPVWSFGTGDCLWDGDRPCFGDTDGDQDVDGADLFNMAQALMPFETIPDFFASLAEAFGRADCPPIIYKLDGLNFSPYREGQDPNQGSAISEDQIRNRFFRIAPYTGRIRSFGTTDGLEKIGPLAHEAGLEAAVGAWITGDATANDRQMQSLIGLAQSGHVDLAIIGSEVLLRGDLTAEQLVDYMAQFKAAVPGVPVTTADVYSALLNHPDVMAASDVILVNYYPFWESLPLAHAMARLNDVHQQMVASAGGKQIIVSETGWPSQGDPQCAAVPSQTNAAQYLTNFVSWASAEDVDYFYFEAFDEPWKATYEGEVGAHWGIWDKDGTMKPCMNVIFQGVTTADNWSCQTMPGGPGAATIAFDYVPPYGSYCNLFGNVQHVDPTQYRVAVYIRVNSGWWTKPYFASPTTPIDCHGFWSCDITTGGIDSSANTIAAFLIPVDYDPPIANGTATLPSELYTNVVAQVEVHRNP